MPDLPTKFLEWPADANQDVAPDRIAELYDQGFAGAVDNPVARKELEKWSIESGGGFANARQVCQHFNVVGEGAGELLLPFLYIADLFPTAIPSTAQGRGSCVAHDTMHACLMSLCAEIFKGAVDEVTGKLEGPPNVSAIAADHGVLSTEAIYWWRRHGGDGWDCASAAKVVCAESGLWLRKPYPEFGIDLTKYNSDTEGKWGRNTPPAEIKTAGQSHLMRITTRVSDFDSYRAFTKKGIGISTCGSEGFAKTRDANGVSSKSGSWAHAMMGNAGLDDRPEIKEMYKGESLILTPQSWGPAWNSGPRDVYKSNHMIPKGKEQDWIAKGIVNPDTGNILIPKGSFWARWSDWKRRYMIAIAGAAGWESALRPLPPFYVAGF